MGIKSSIRTLFTSNLEVVFFFLSVLFLVNLVIITFFAKQYSSDSQSISVLTVGFAFAFASLIFGFFIGFIFGLPRIHPQESHPLGSHNINTSFEGEPTQCSLYSENSNLENISDWLSKILVGLGLIQLTQIPTYLRQFTEFIEPVLSGQQVNTGIIGIPILIFCLFDGFLIGYLWTRCYAPTEFGKKRSELQKFTNDIKIYKQDYEAITLAKRILDQETELPIQEEFNQKIKKASDNAKDYIFYLAEKERKSSRESSIEDPENKISHLLKMELTIPVFRALVTSNPENYRAHAQLGFALKDKKNPAWKEALDELNKAITKFPENDKYNYKYRLYKINRAVCNINLDPDYQIDIETKDRKRLESILEDILYCVDSEYIQKNFINDGNKPFQKWMAINKYSINNLNTCIQQYNYQNNEIPTN